MENSNTTHNEPSSNPQLVEELEIHVERSRDKHDDQMEVPQIQKVYSSLGEQERIYVPPKYQHFNEISSIPEYRRCKFIYGKQPDALYRIREDRVGTLPEILKVIIIGFVFQLFWIRLLGNFISFFFFFFLVILLTLVTRKSYEKMTGLSRKIFNLLLSLGARISLFFFGIWRIKITKVSQEEFDKIRRTFSKLPENNYLSYSPFYIISNHISIVDPLVIILLFGPFSIVCKQAVRKIPLIGLACELLQCIFVGSNTAETESKMKEREQRYIQRINSENPELRKKVPPQLLIFPEGTTTTGNYVIRFHGGAFRNGQPVQPVFIEYPHKNFNMSWVQLGFSFFVYCLGQVYNSCSVYVLPPYIPNESEKADWKLYAYNVQRMLVEIGNLYRPLHKSVKMSNELFFRNPNKKLEHERKRENESKIHYRWRRFVDRTREIHRDNILITESLQTGIDDPVDFIPEA